MSTKGNLELKFNETVLCASTISDGYRAFESIPRLVKFLDSVKKPKKEQLDKWFRSMSKRILPEEYSESLIGGCPCEVIMDIPRKLILHNGNEDVYSAVSVNFPDKFDKACDTLRKKYDYTILHYICPEVRQFMKNHNL